MKKIIAMILMVATLVTCCAFGFTACDNKETIVVYTNAYFAPFEYYDGTDIVGVDVDIMNMVGDKLNKNVKFEQKEFGTLIDYVADGKMCDCSAAGFTITEARKQKVNFSVTYFKSIQYVIFKKTDAPQQSQAADGTACFMWSDLGGKKIGVQLNTTGDIYVSGEIDGWDAETPGAIQGTNASCKQYKDAQLAYATLKSNTGVIDCVVVDELPAQYLIKNDTTDYIALPLYYDANTATLEEYGIAVNKNNTELLDAINEVLNDLLTTKNADGKNGVEQLVEKHFGIN